MTQRWLRHSTIWEGVLKERGHVMADERMKPLHELGHLRFLALGDSYTIGEGVRAAERWPVQLAKQLRKRGFAVASPDIIAKTGWTASELLAGIGANEPQGPYDLVSVLVGVNDQYRGYSLPEYVQTLRLVFEEALVLAGGRTNRVFVVSIPDWGATPFAEEKDRAKISSEIDAFNAAKADEARQRGFSFVDVTALSRQAMKDDRLLAEDGLHPSGAMYTEWVAHMQTSTVALLQGCDHVAIK